MLNVVFVLQCLEKKVIWEPIDCRYLFDNLQSHLVTVRNVDYTISVGLIPAAQPKSLVILLFSLIALTGISAICFFHVSLLSSQTPRYLMLSSSVRLPFRKVDRCISCALHTCFVFSKLATTFPHSTQWQAPEMFIVIIATCICLNFWLDLCWVCADGFSESRKSFFQWQRLSTCPF